MSSVSRRILGLMVLLLTCCGPKAGISEVRMANAPSRDATCALELVEVDITAVTFNQQWEVLGYVTLADYSVQDPSARENRELVRPRACAMGGTAVANAIGATNTNQVGQQASGVSYMVLRPKTFATQPTAF